MSNSVAELAPAALSLDTASCRMCDGLRRLAADSMPQPFLLSETDLGPTPFRFHAMDEHPTVFLVDDDQQMRESIKWLLERNGYQVVASASATAALATYDPSRHGCLLLDIQLPETTGIELHEQLRERGGSHPFIIITAYGRVPVAVEAMRLGAVDFIEKPFNSEQLLKRVAEAVARDAKNRLADTESKELLDRLNVLARRERQIAELVADGKSSKAIARELGIKVRTVEVHRHNINKKLGTESPAELTALIAKAKVIKDQVSGGGES